MKKQMILFIIICGVFFVDISYGDDYFPLQIGNVWYGGGSDAGCLAITDTIVAVDTTTGYSGLMYTGYIHPFGYPDSISISYYEWNGYIYRYEQGIWCKKDLQVGDWWYELADSTIHTVVAEESLSVPAGNFQSMKVYWEPNIHNDGEFDWFVDCVGLIKTMYWESSDTSTTVLDSAVVNGVHYPAVNSINEEIVISNYFRLEQNYPNPFNPKTTISFSIPNDSKVALFIYNIKGQKIKTLTYENLRIGHHKFIWNGKDENDEPVSSGIYFYKMETDNFSEIKKCILLK